MAGPGGMKTIIVQCKGDAIILKHEAEEWIDKSKVAAAAAPQMANGFKTRVAEVRDNLLNMAASVSVATAPVYSGDQKKVENTQRIFMTSVLLLLVANVFKQLGSYVFGPLLLNWMMDGPTKALYVFIGLPLMYRYVEDVFGAVTGELRPNFLVHVLGAAIGLLTGSMLSHRYTYYWSSYGLFFPLLATFTAHTFDKQLAGRQFPYVMAATVGAGAVAELVFDTIISGSLSFPLLLLVALQAVLQTVAMVALINDMQNDTEGKLWARTDRHAKLLQLIIWALVQTIGHFALGYAYVHGGAAGEEVPNAAAPGPVEGTPAN